mmetsp:Transcript_8341/g.25055  ORF Transcript_8341/g.25055 Transcript_8341/m.25055 type:complete len:215 (+) Transcript_8341:92-736(+)
MGVRRSPLVRKRSLEAGPKASESVHASAPETKASQPLHYAAIGLLAFFVCVLIAAARTTVGLSAGLRRAGLRGGAAAGACNLADASSPLSSFNATLQTLRNCKLDECDGARCVVNYATHAVTRDGLRRLGVRETVGRCVEGVCVCACGGEGGLPACHAACDPACPKGGLPPHPWWKECFHTELTGACHAAPSGHPRTYRAAERAGKTGQCYDMF